MSRYSRLATAGSGAPDERLRHPSSNTAKTGGHGEEICCKGNGHAKVKKDVPQHRRVNSAADINLRRLRERQMLGKQSRDESIPEPTEDVEETQRRTWQTQWTDALRRVQSLRLSGAGTQSERWSGVATDIYRPKSLTALDTQHASNARTSHAPTARLDRWNYYPGPSVNRDIPQSQLDPENGSVGAGARNKSFLGGAMSNREGELFGGGTTGNFLKGRGSKSISSLGKIDLPLEATQSVISDDSMVAEQGRSSTNSSSTPSVHQFNELQRPESYSTLASRVQRTQSHRYGRTWGQKPDANHPIDSNSSAYQNAAVPNPILKKAISMREGGAHQDAVLEMARAYTDTVCGVPKTLECASCGRNLGIIVQGNPGVDIAFCQACRPSPMQWKKPISDNAAGSRKKKNAIMQFCKKILRLDKNQVK